MKLDLPASMFIHQVINAALVKKYHRDQLLLKAVQVKDDTEYRGDSIVYHQRYTHY